MLWAVQNGSAFTEGKLAQSWSFIIVCNLLQRSHCRRYLRNTPARVWAAVFVSLEAAHSSIRLVNVYCTSTEPKDTLVLVLTHTWDTKRKSQGVLCKLEEEVRLFPFWLYLCRFQGDTHCVAHGVAQTRREPRRGFLFIFVLFFRWPCSRRSCWAMSQLGTGTLECAIGWYKTVF